MTQKEHEELLEKVQQVMGDKYDWFLSYCEKGTGEGLTVKSGDGSEISKCMFYSIISNMDGDNEGSAMALYKTIEGAVINVLSHVERLKMPFLHLLNRATAHNQKDKDTDKQKYN